MTRRVLFLQWPGAVVCRGLPRSDYGRLASWRRDRRRSIRCSSRLNADRCDWRCGECDMAGGFTMDRVAIRLSRRRQPSPLRSAPFAAFEGCFACLRTFPQPFWCVTCRGADGTRTISAGRMLLQAEGALVCERTCIATGAAIVVVHFAKLATHAIVSVFAIRGHMLFSSGACLAVHRCLRFGLLPTSRLVIPTSRWRSSDGLDRLGVGGAANRRVIVDESSHRAGSGRNPEGLTLEFAMPEVRVTS